MVIVVVMMVMLVVSNSSSKCYSFDLFAITYYLLVIT